MTVDRLRARGALGDREAYDGVLAKVRDAEGVSMSSDLSFVEFVCDQMRGAGSIRFRKMFGEFAIYCDDKVVALVCDDQLFVKPTQAGRTLIEEPVEAPPYAGAKPYFLIDSLDDREWLSHLIELTARELPAPKPKRQKP